MIADDDVTLAENLKEYLESRGHSVFLVHDGVTASEKAQERKPDPIVMDIMMPGAYGTTSYVSLDNAGFAKRTRFVFISSHPIEKIRSRLPADHPRMRFVPKPIDLKAFEGVVRELLAA